MIIFLYIKMKILSIIILVLPKVISYNWILYLRTKNLHFTTQMIFKIYLCEKKLQSHDIIMDLFELWVQIFLIGIEYIRCVFSSFRYRQNKEKLESLTREEVISI